MKHLNQQQQLTLDQVAAARQATQQQQNQAAQPPVPVAASAAKAPAVNSVAQPLAAQQQLQPLQGLPGNNALGLRPTLPQNTGGNAARPIGLPPGNQAGAMAKNPDIPQVLVSLQLDRHVSLAFDRGALPEGTCRVAALLGRNIDLCTNHVSWTVLTNVE